MKKNFKTVKATLLIGVLLGSLLIVLMPSAVYAAESSPTSDEIKSTAGLGSYLKLNWTTSDEPIIPIDDLRYYKISIDYEVTIGAIFARFLYPLHIGNQVNIRLTVIDSNPWCTANIAIGTLTTQVKTVGAPNKLTADISIELDKDAPAYGSGYVTIRASIPKVGLITGYEQDFTLKFKPAYLPLIQAELPSTNTKTIGPMDTATFPIKIRNMGNARTLVRLEVESGPSDWIAVVTDEILVDVDGTATAYLTIRPPKGMGYHDDDGAFKVTMTPHRAENPTMDVGAPSTITVVVESRGFSTIGMEAVLPVIIIIFLLLVFVYWFIKKQRKK